MTKLPDGDIGEELRSKFCDLLDEAVAKATDLGREREVKHFLWFAARECLHQMGVLQCWIREVKHTDGIADGWYCDDDHLWHYFRAGEVVCDTEIDKSECSYDGPHARIGSHLGGNVCLGCLGQMMEIDDV